MTDYAYLVNVLYEHLGTWRGVAEACGDTTEKRGVYWDIAHGRIKKLSRAKKIAILNAVDALESCVVKSTVPPRDLERRNVKIPVDLFKRMAVLKSANNETWEQYQEKALQARMEER